MNDLVDVLLLSLANLIILVILLMRTDAQLKKIRSIESFLAKMFAKASEKSDELDDIPPSILEQVKAGKINKAAVEYTKFYDVSINEAHIAVRQLNFKIQRRATAEEALSKTSPPAHPG